MEIIYVAMLLHKLGKSIDENHIKKVLHSLDVHVDEAKIKALINALEGVNIDEVIKEAAFASAPSEHKEKPKEEKKEEVKMEDAAVGLGSLFG